MGKEDFEVNSRMYQIFNQYRIDQTTISYRCFGGIVYIEGMIRQEGSPDDYVKPEIMENIHRSIRGIKHVKRVKYDLVNMTQAAGGGWIYTKTVKREEGRTWQLKDPTEGPSKPPGGGGGGGGEGGDKGITLVEMMIVVALIGVIAAIAIPRLTEARLTANESSAIGTLKAIGSAQAQFQQQDSEEDGEQDYATNLAELSQAGLVDNVVGSGQKSGYLFHLSGSTFEWLATATPMDVNAGRRSFYVDTKGVIRYSTTAPPDGNSEPIAQ